MKKSGLIYFLLIQITYLQAQNEGLSDKRATLQTQKLFANLKKISEKGFMVGHQDALAYGVTWKYESGRSDVKDVTGDYPAVYGWDIGHLEIGSFVNLDSVPFDKMRQFIGDAYQRGGVITISWHGNNPVTSGTSWDNKKGTVASILPGKENNQFFRAQLDKVADFMLSLKGGTGELIPVLFRPFHEHTGGWFWWGNSATSNAEYKELFRYTVTYLRDIKHVHNLVYVYNTGSNFSNSREFLKRYPGDDVVDVFSFDTYQSGNAEVDFLYVKKLDFHLSIIEKLATEKAKVTVIGETGYNQIPYSKWWTKNLAIGIGSHKIAYVLFWRNAGYKPKEKYTEYYIPYKGHVSENDFIDFYNLPQTLFQKDISYDEMYK